MSEVPELQRHRLFQAQARANLEPRVAPATGECKAGQLSTFDRAIAQARAAALDYEVAQAAKASISRVKERPVPLPVVKTTTPQGASKPQGATVSAQAAAAAAPTAAAAAAARAAQPAGRTSAEDTDLACIAELTGFEPVPSGTRTDKKVQPVKDTASSKQKSSGTKLSFKMPTMLQRTPKVMLTNEIDLNELAKPQGQTATGSIQHQATVQQPTIEEAPQQQATKQQADARQQHTAAPRTPKKEKGSLMSTIKKKITGKSGRSKDVKATVPASTDKQPTSPRIAAVAPAKLVIDDRVEDEPDLFSPRDTKVRETCRHTCTYPTCMKPLAGSAAM